MLFFSEKMDIFFKNVQNREKHKGALRKDFNFFQERKMNNIMHNEQESFEMYNIAPRELAKLREIVEKIFKMHSVDCSKCYEDAQKRLELQEKYPDAVDFDDEEPLYAVDKIVGHRVRSDGKRERESFFVQWAGLKFNGKLNHVH
jgi:hypothetical protein